MLTQNKIIFSFLQPYHFLPYSLSRNYELLASHSTYKELPKFYQIITCSAVNSLLYITGCLAKTGMNSLIFSGKNFILSSLCGLNT